MNTTHKKKVALLSVMLCASSFAVQGQSFPVGGADERTPSRSE